MTEQQMFEWLEEVDTHRAGRPVVRALCEPIGWAMDVRGPVIDALLGPPACAFPLRSDQREGRG